MALFDSLSRRVADRTHEVANEAIERAKAVFAQFPDIMLRREGDELVISARGLMRRWMSDVRLRFALRSGR